MLLGLDEEPGMLVDIANIIKQHDLGHLEATFSNQGIDNVICHMPNVKSHSPHGFNIIYMKE
jgi:hypothetical protein